MDEANANSMANGTPLPPFLSKTYDMVDDPSTDSIVSWSPSNNSFVVWDVAWFSRDLLPKYFKHKNFSSFVRQLNTYGFKKVDPDRWEFSNEGFVRGKKHLLKSINRRKPTHVPSQPQQPQQQNKSVGACVEVGKFGIEEEIERLKRDKNVLMQELVKLRQQQQTTDRQLQTVVQHLQGMEQRQQQMMSFLAKAMQSPGFLAQLVQQNENSRRISVVNKKRRIPGQEGNLAGGSEAIDGQIVKYQLSLNDSAKSILTQMLKIDKSTRLEPSDGFLIGDTPVLPLASDDRNRVSGVTLSEFPPTSSGLQYMPVSSGSPATLPSAAVSETQSSIGVQEPIVSCCTDMIIPEIPQMREQVPESSGIDVPSSSYVVPVPKAENGYPDPMSGEMDGIVTDTEKFPSDTDMAAYAFWEEFLLESPVLGDMGAGESSSREVTMNEIQPEEENGNYHLAAQMADLMAETRQ